MIHHHAKSKAIPSIILIIYLETPRLTRFTKSQSNLGHDELKAVTIILGSEGNTTLYYTLTV